MFAVYLAVGVKGVPTPKFCRANVVTQFASCARQNDLNGPRRVLI